MSSRIVGVFTNEEDVIREIKKYEEKGVSRDNFSVISRDNERIAMLINDMKIDHENPEGPFGLLGGYFSGLGGTAGTPSQAGYFFAGGPRVTDFFSDNPYDSIGNLEDRLSDEYIEELEAGNILLLLKE